MLQNQSVPFRGPAAESASGLAVNSVTESRRVRRRSAPRHTSANPADPPKPRRRDAGRGHTAVRRRNARAGALHTIASVAIPGRRAEARVGPCLLTAPADRCCGGPGCRLTRLDVEAKALDVGEGAADTGLRLRVDAVPAAARASDHAAAWQRRWGRIVPARRMRRPRRNPSALAPPHPLHPHPRPHSPHSPHSPQPPHPHTLT